MEDVLREEAGWWMTDTVRVEAGVPAGDPEIRLAEKDVKMCGGFSALGDGS